MKKKWIMSRKLIAFAVLALLVLGGVFYTAGAEITSFADLTEETPDVSDPTDPNSPGNGTEAETDLLLFQNASTAAMDYTIVGIKVNGTSVSSSDWNSFYYMDGDTIEFELQPKSGLLPADAVYDSASLSATTAFTATTVSANENSSKNVVLTFDTIARTDSADKAVKGEINYTSATEAGAILSIDIPIANKKTSVGLSLNADAFSSRTYDGSVDVDIDPSVDMKLALISGDLVSGFADVSILDATAASYELKYADVPTSKQIVVGGLQLDGADAGRYVLETDVNVGKDLRRVRTVTPVIKESDRPRVRAYDGTKVIRSSAMVTLEGVLAVDNSKVGFTQESGAIAEFTNKDVEEQKAILMTKVVLTGEKKDNYAIQYDETNYPGQNAFVIENLGALITKRPIGVLIEDQAKTYGTADPAVDYSVTSVDGGSNTGLATGDGKEDVLLTFSRKGAGVFTAGGKESVGSYTSAADRITVASVGNPNYEISDDAYIVAGAMEILPLTAEVQTVLYSRTGSILITNSAGADLLPEAVPQIVVQLSKDRVELNAAEYIDGTALPGVSGGFMAGVDLVPGATTLNVKRLVKHEQHGAITYAMPTRIPADTAVQIMVQDPAGKRCAEWSFSGVNSSDTTYLDMVRKYEYAAPTVDFFLSDNVTSAEYAIADPVTGRRFVKPDSFMYIQQDADAATANELIKIVYESISVDTGATIKETFYTQNLFLRRALKSATYDGVRHPQSITISYVDQDLANEDQVVTFVYSDGFSKLTEENLEMENRGKTATITLPTPGTIDRLTIDGKSYTPTRISETVYELDLSWLEDPSMLPASGLKVSITYTDTYLNESDTCELTVSRSGPVAAIMATIDPSSVSSIIDDGSTSGIPTFGIARTSGKYPNMLLSGTATHYEALRIRIGNYIETIKVSGTGAYDTTFATRGRWNVSIDMDKLVKDGYLIEDITYPVTVIYNDVDGKGATMNIVMTGGGSSGGDDNSSGSSGSSGGSGSGSVGSVTNEELEELFDELEEMDDLALSVFAYPQYVRYGYLLGVTQPYNLIYAVGDATTQGTADDTGFFSIKVPQESGTFYTVMVADEEENVGFTTFTSGLDGDTTVPAYPLGLMMLSEDDMGETTAYPATPLMTDILGPEETIEMSLLLGNALKVGTVEVSRNANDEITVNARLNDNLSAYNLDDIYLTVFDGMPDAMEMGNYDGVSYDLGEAIPVGGIEPWLMLEINLPADVIEANGGMVGFTNPDDADAVLYRKLAYYY